MVNKKLIKKVNDKVLLMVKCLVKYNDIWVLVWVGGGGLFFNFLNYLF